MQELPPDEIKRLQRCINDLVSLLALPAVWSGSEPAQIVHILLGALLRMLRLDFIYARLEEPVEAAPVEFFRIADSCKVRLEPPEVQLTLSKWFGGGTRKSLPPARSRLGGVDLSIFPLPLGVHGEMGIIVVGSERADFPCQTESLLLSLAANQASIGLQEARLLHQHKQLAVELDQRVAQRTSELAETNQELRREIAERRRAEEALRDREQSLRLILDGIAGLVAIMSATGKVEAVNRQVVDYFGRSAAEMKGWSTSDAVHPDDLPGAVSAWMHSIETASAYDVDHRLRRADGVYRWFHARGLPLRDAEGRVLRWYVLLTDIDDRRRTEEELREKELDMRSLLNNMPGLLARFSQDGIPEIFNRQILEYIGRTAEEMSEWRMNDIVHPDDLAHTIERFGKAIANCRPFDFQYRLRRFDGVYRWFQFRAVPVHTADGRILHWNALVTDIDERKRAAEELRVAQSELARVMRVMTMGQLTASIAHEVNQPLSGIITNASTCLRMLSADPPNVEGARETARRTIRDGNRASDVITRLRTLYSKKDPSPEAVDLNEVTREVTSLSLSELQSRRVILRHEFADDLPSVIGDRVQLQQVILNLLRNAADAMSGIEDRPRELLIKTQCDDGDRVRLSVKDAGVGFTPQAVDKLFEAFFTTKSDGMGIGLSISRSIIEAHRGRLWATVNDGPGATFAFSIPCRRENPADIETRLNQANPAIDAA